MIHYHLSTNLTSLIAVDRLEHDSDLADSLGRRRTAPFELPLLPPLFKEELFNRWSPLPFRRENDLAHALSFFMVSLFRANTRKITMPLEDTI